MESTSSCQNLLRFVLISFNPKSPVPFPKCRQQGPCQHGTYSADQKTSLLSNPTVRCSGLPPAPVLADKKSVHALPSNCRYILILSSTYAWVLRVCLSLVFPTKTVHTAVFSPTPTTCLIHLILLPLLQIFLVLIFPTRATWPSSPPCLWNHIFIKLCTYPK